MSDAIQNLAASNARTDLADANWTYEVWPTDFSDLVKFNSSAQADSASDYFPLGVPSVTVDARNTDETMGYPDATRPDYTNDTDSYPILPDAVDNTDLEQPTSPGIWIGQGDKTNGGAIRNFVRLFPSDIGADPYDGVAKRGAWLQKVYTGEKCSNTSYRYFLCTPCFDDMDELG